MKFVIIYCYNFPNLYLLIGMLTTKHLQNKKFIQLWNNEGE